MKVDYIPEQRIEAEAEHLIKSFEFNHGKIVGYKIPVEDIAELHLGYSFAYTDLRKYYPNDEVHGMINFDTNEMLIHEGLEPHENPQYAGRCNYTIAHECGHDVLHKAQVIEALKQTDLFKQQEPNQILCRTDDATESIEWQADRFAMYLLMPKANVHEFWKEHFGSYEPKLKTDFTNGFKQVTQAIKTESELLEIALKDTAKDVFGVSAQALRIRLEGMGLLADYLNEPAMV